MYVLDAIAAYGTWAWLLLAVILLIAEAHAPGLHFVWFGVAAALVGVLALITDIPPAWQLMVFAVTAVTAVIFARRLARSSVTLSDLPNLNMRGAQNIGRIVTVEEPIRGGRGKVRVGDTVWQAEGPDAAAGMQVKVTGLNGTVLKVEHERP